MANENNQNLNSNTNSTIKPANNQNSFKEIEQQRFSTYNPLMSDSIRFKKMYWSSTMEITARVILLVTSLLLLIFSYFLAANLINPVLTKNGVISSSTNLKPAYMIYIVMAVTIGFNLVFYLPLAIGRNANTVFNWSVIYIILGIGYFIALEVLCTVLLVINGITEASVSSSVPIFMGLILVITIIWLVGACLLIVKSDDVRKELSVE